MKLKFSWNVRITTGLIMGVIAPLLAAPLVMFIVSWAQGYPFALFWRAFVDSSDSQSKILSLAIIANLGIFFLFLNRERYDIARGIIIGSALYLPYILYLKYF